MGHGAEGSAKHNKALAQRCNLMSEDELTALLVRAAAFALRPFFCLTLLLRRFAGDSA
jgi:hypothetical protein